MMYRHCGYTPVICTTPDRSETRIECAACELKTEHFTHSEDAVARWNQIVKCGYTPEDIEQIALYNKLMQEKRNDAT